MQIVHKDTRRQDMIKIQDNTLDKMYDGARHGNRRLDRTQDKFTYKAMTYQTRRDPGTETYKNNTGWWY